MGFNGIISIKNTIWEKIKMPIKIITKCKWFHRLTAQCMRKQYSGRKIRPYCCASSSGGGCDKYEEGQTIWALDRSGVVEAD